ncbi:MAG: MgtC/SapB family protein [Gemmatimonadota bacterium]
MPPLTLVEYLAVAALIGLAVGTEREWSGPTAGPERRFAGLRTFLLLGILGGVAGLLIGGGATVPGSVLLAGGVAFNVVAYSRAVHTTQSPRDGTTEAAGLVVLALATLAGLGYLLIAAGAGAVVVFALGEKQRLHWLVRRIGQEEMHAALQFLVLALVILPLLPTGPYDAFWGFRPRVLWAMVLLLSGINFAGYLARRLVGPGKGYGVTGALAGLISSTALTLQFARISRAEPQHARGLALGVIAACTVLPVRLVIVSLALSPMVALHLLWFAVPAFVVGAACAVWLLRKSGSAEATTEPPKSPLRLWSALQLAIAFEVAFIAIRYAQAHFGSTGMVGSAVFFGVADLDALTVSMNRLAVTGESEIAAARAIGIGLLTNTVSKMAIAVVIGGKAFRKLAVGGLLVTAMALGAVLWWRW